MSGTGDDSRITGIDSVEAPTDAVNVKTIQDGRLLFGVASGSNNAFEVDLEPAVAAYVPGMVLHFQANHAVTGDATLEVNGLGAIPVRKHFSEELDENDIRENQLVTVIFDGTNFQMLSQLGNAPAAGGGGGKFDPTLIYTTNGF